MKKREMGRRIRKRRCRFTVVLFLKWNEKGRREKNEEEEVETNGIDRVLSLPSLKQNRTEWSAWERKSERNFVSQDSTRICRRNISVWLLLYSRAWAVRTYRVKQNSTVEREARERRWRRVHAGASSWLPLLSFVLTPSPPVSQTRRGERVLVNQIWFFSCLQTFSDSIQTPLYFTFMSYEWMSLSFLSMEGV